MTEENNNLLSMSVKCLNTFGYENNLDQLKVGKGNRGSWNKYLKLKVKAPQLPP